MMPSVTELTLSGVVSLNSVALTVIGWVVSKFRSDAHLIKTMESRAADANVKLINEKHDASVKLINEKHDALHRLLSEHNELTDKLIDERLRRISHDIDQHSQRNMSAVDIVTVRMEKAMDKLDSTVDALGEKDHGLEIKILREIAAVQKEVAEKAATKADLKDHQRSMSEKVGGLEQKLEGFRRGSN